MANKDHNSWRNLSYRRIAFGMHKWEDMASTNDPSHSKEEGMKWCNACEPLNCMVRTESIILPSPATLSIHQKNSMEEGNHSLTHLLEPRELLGASVCEKESAAVKAVATFEELGSTGKTRQHDVDTASAEPLDEIIKAAVNRLVVAKDDSPASPSQPIKDVDASTPKVRAENLGSNEEKLVSGSVQQDGTEPPEVPKEIYLLHEYMTSFRDRRTFERGQLTEI